MEFIVVSLIILWTTDIFQILNAILAFNILEQLSEHTDSVRVPYESFFDNENQKLKQHQIFRLDVADSGEYLVDPLLVVFWICLILLLLV